jgi:hypothetical protein
MAQRRHFRCRRCLSGSIKLPSGLPRRGRERAYT